MSSNDFAKRLRNLSNPIPESRDPEEFDKITNSTENQVENTEIEEIDINKNVYFGKKVNKKNIDFLQTENDNDSENNMNDIDSMVEKETESIEYETYTGSNDENESVGSVEDEEEDLVLIKKQKNKAAKSAQVKSQIKIWNNLMGIRIRMQPILLKTLKFPSTVKKFNSSSVKETFQSLLKLQNSLLVASDRYRVTRKRSYKAFIQGQSSSEVWGNLSKENDEILGFCGECFDAWQDRFDVMDGVKDKYKSLNMSVTKQVSAAMQSKQVIARNQQLPKALKKFGSKRERTFDKSVYIDTMFYQQLLKDFIAFSGRHNVDNPTQNLVKTKLKRKKRANVDVKASKGRRLKYLVHDKLTNFAPSVPEEASRIEDSLNDRIFKSLFAFS